MWCKHICMSLVCWKILINDQSRDIQYYFDSILFWSFHSCSYMFLVLVLLSTRRKRRSMYASLIHFFFPVKDFFCESVPLCEEVWLVAFFTIILFPFNLIFSGEFKSFYCYIDLYKVLHF